MTDIKRQEGEVDHLAHTNRPGQINIRLDELEHRFTYHAPTGEARDLHHDLRIVVKRLAKELAFLLPAGREKSLAITHLEEASFWAHAAIARDPSLHSPEDQG